MSSSNLDSEVTPEEQFIRQALARVEKAARYTQIMRVLTTVLLLVFVFWFAFKPTSPQMQVEAVVMMGVALIVATCTAKIMLRLNENTKAVLQAIADLHQRGRG